MMKLLRNIVLSFFIFVSMSFFLAVKIEAFSFNYNPVSFLSQTASIIASRALDVVNYLIIQKEYIFNHFTDPNNYTSLGIPENINQILPSASTPMTKVVTSATQNTVNLFVSPTLDQVSSSTADINSNFLSNPESQITPAENSDDLQILDYTNKERLTASLKPLSADATLNAIANLRAGDLFANQYFEHESPDGKSVSDLARNLNYSYLTIGENLARGNFDGDQGIVSAWMESAGHRANILNAKYTELGVAVKTGIFNGENVTIAVQVFALPLASCSKPNPGIKVLIDSATISIKQMQGEALATYNNLNTIKTSPNLDLSYYNQKIQEYNYFARKVNDAIAALKDIIDSYNAEVYKYNSCISP